MSTLEEVKASIIDEFSMFDEWLDKYEYLIEMGKNLDVFPVELKTDDRLIKGCQSRVWLDTRFEDGKLFFRADSDAIITKGIVNLLIRVLSERTPQEIIDNDLEYLNAIGLKEHLSPTRSNGLASMIKQIKLYAVAFKAKEC